LRESREEAMKRRWGGWGEGRDNRFLTSQGLPRELIFIFVLGTAQF
jgi:hypothetical protein